MQGNTALHIAVMMKNIEVVTLLLEENKDCQVELNTLFLSLPIIHENRLNGKGLAPLHIATVNNTPKIVEALLAHGADANIRGFCFDSELIFVGGPNQQTALHFSVQELPEKPEIVILLLKVL